MLSQIIIIITMIKILLIPFYYSTDFEVHRNWLAITHNLTIDEWYYDKTSEWTLDYPPFFAWLEYFLSHVAKWFDPKMLYLTNLNYNSDMTVLFQRMSVIVLDFVFIMAAKSCSNLLSSGRFLVFLLLVSNPGLIMVDHMHFQYNGFLFGILLFSVSDMIKSNFVQSAIWFAILLNFKHIFLYMAPAFFVHLLRAYCFIIHSEDGVHTPWYTFSLANFCKLAFNVIAVFILSFAPFIDHIPQIMSRLFPFKRGLCHAYWAPNFWALYNLADKILYHIGTRLGYDIPKVEATMTGGLVQEYKHTVLPTVTPMATFILIVLTMTPALIKLWHLGADRHYRNISFIRCMILCATCSFMFGWHVHEKAILLIIIPLSFMSVLGDVDGRQYLLMSMVGHYSLFPLLYPKSLMAIKLFLWFTHAAMSLTTVPSFYLPKKVKGPKKKRILRLPLLTRTETLYIYGLLCLFIYENVFHPAWGLDKKLPFLPLMMTSCYCAVGVLWFFIKYYEYFLGFTLSPVPPLAVNLSKYEKTTKTTTTTSNTKDQ